MDDEEKTTSATSEENGTKEIITRESVKVAAERLKSDTEALKKLKRQKIEQDIKNYFHDAFVNKHGVIVWLISSVVWFFIAFGAFMYYNKKYTTELVRACYENEIKKELEIPMAKARDEADKIIQDAKKKAQKIIDTASTEISQ